MAARTLRRPTESGLRSPALFLVCRGFLGPEAGVGADHQFGEFSFVGFFLGENGAEPGTEEAKRNADQSRIFQREKRLFHEVRANQDEDDARGEPDE